MKMDIFQIVFDGIVSKIFLSLNNIKFIIRTQQIISNKIDGEIPDGVSSEKV